MSCMSQYAVMYVVCVTLLDDIRYITQWNMSCVLHYLVMYVMYVELLHNIYIRYGVAAVSRIDKINCLFCKRDL